MDTILLDVEQIKELMPHRYPFLLVDRIISADSGKSIRGLSNVSINSPIFQGHFPEYPVYPGVIMVETAAQVVGILAYLTLGEKPQNRDELYYFAGIKEAKFKRVVVPGDQLIIEAEIINTKRNFSFIQSAITIKVLENVVCTAIISIARKQS